MRFALYILLSLSLQATAQSTITLRFATDVPLDTITFFNFAQTTFIVKPFSSEIHLETNVSQADLYNLYFNFQGKRYKKQLWLNAGVVQLLGQVNKAGVQIDTIVGSPLYYGVQKFYTKLRAILNSKDSLQLEKYLKDAFEEFRESPFSLEIAEVYVDHFHNSPQKLLPLREDVFGLNDEIKKHFFYRALTKRIQKLLEVKSVDLSRFTFYNQRKQADVLTIADGGRVKRMIVDFWHTGCAPCVQQHGQVLDYFEKMVNNGVAFVSISSDASFEKWATYLQKHKYPWKNVIAREPSNIVSHLDIRIYPTYLILDANGNILSSYYSFDEVLKAINLP